MAEGIRADRLSVLKQRQTILDSLSFSISPGVLTGLIGPSGSGKTTLMRTIVGLQIPSKGGLMVNEKSVGSSTLRREIGYVTQDPAIYDDLTVEQNLAYFAKLITAPKQSIGSVIKAVDLEPQRKQLASTLSGGQRARVSLAIALLGNPSVLILDEPTVGLDPVLRQKLWKLFTNLAKNGKTIVISSHVMDEAERCEQVLLLRDGKLLWQASKANLLKSTSTHSVEDAFLQLVGDKK
ncbi:TPA: multidrug ABC transporter ATP-binding protein [Candidatus Saccharibacteria bacterium]|nr:multidrug ABC transporter ATP-binding protein [Candidatus Saccharibacteria bacterium]HRJ90849.1 ABC transporter ATP-binding protein [Candidatus Saccharibacteria bacterium]